jgi:hypothetical protein
MCQKVNLNFALRKALLAVSLLPLTAHGQKALDREARSFTL